MWRSEAPFSTIAFRSWCRLGKCVPSAHGVRRGVPDDLFDAGHAGLQLRQTGHAQRLHAEADGLRLELGGRGAVDHQLLDAVPEGHHLVEGDAALVAAIVAGPAAPGLEDLEGAGLV